MLVDEVRGLEGDGARLHVNLRLDRDLGGRRFDELRVDGIELPVIVEGDGCLAIGVRPSEASYIKSGVEVEVGGSPARAVEVEVEVVTPEDRVVMVAVSPEMAVFIAPASALKVECLMRLLSELEAYPVEVVGSKVIKRWHPLYAALMEVARWP